MALCMVTGGCGFIGRHLVKRLVGDGHTVRVLDINTRGFQSLPVPLSNCYMRNVARFPHLPGIGVPDVVFHLAAVSRTVPACADPVECIRTNVLGTAKVLEACRRAGVPRVVVSSSNVVLAGATAYRDSKKAVEDLCETYTQLYGQSVIALRYSNVYGPGIPVGDEAVFAKLRDSFNTRGYAEVTGNGEQTRDFTHVSDIVNGNILAWGGRELTRVHTSGGIDRLPIEALPTGVVDLCTGRQTSINEACRLLTIPVRYIADRPGDVKGMYQNPARAANILRWSAEVRIEHGINDIWES